MRNYRSKLSKMLICFQKHATFWRSISSQSSFYAATKNSLPPWPITSVNKNAVLSFRVQRILRQTKAINRTAFSYSRLPLGSRVFVQNAISKNWDLQSVVKAMHDNGESYIVQLDNGKERIRGCILLRPDKSTIPTAHSTPTLSTGQTLCTVPPDFKTGYIYMYICFDLSQFRKLLQVSKTFNFSHLRIGIPKSISLELLPVNIPPLVLLYCS